MSSPERSPLPMQSPRSRDCGRYSRREDCNGHRKTVPVILERLLEHLPKATVEEVRIGPFWAAVVVSGPGGRHCGLAAATTPAMHAHAEPPVRDAGHLLERDARELAGLVSSERPLEATVGLATINALLEVNEAALREENALHMLQRRGAGRRVALVGHFPFIPRLRPAVGDLAVLELHPRPGDIPADQAAAVIPQADVVAITSSTLINHTLEGLLALCRPDAWVMLLGPSTPLTPLLFEYGVDALAGVQVVDVATALRFISQGATFRQMRGVRTVIMGRPGERSTAQ